MTNKKKDGFLFAGNEIFLEELYERFLKDPNLIDVEWRDYFSKLKTNENKIEIPSDRLNKLGKVIIDNEYEDKPKQDTSSNNLNISLDYLAKIIIEKYQDKGHLLANLDPLGL